MPKILIVDDEWLTRLEIEGMLTDLGYDVAGQAETGAEAVAMARALNPDLILMDVKMPGEMNGIDAAREIKAELGTPIVFISGYGDPEYIEAAKDVAPFGYVMKPFDGREVHAFVEIALSRRKLELELEESHERLEQTNLDLRKEIAARKNTEMALREREEEYRELVENANSIILKYDLDNRIILFNEYAQRFFGYRKGEILGKDIMIIVPKMGSIGRSLGTLAQDILKTPEKFVENINQNICRNGEIVWISWTNKAIIDSEGKVIGNLSIGQDITERKQAEDKVRKAYSEVEKKIEERTIELSLVNADLTAKMADHKRAEKALQESEKDLKGKGIRLEELNSALKILLEKGDRDRKELEEKTELLGDANMALKIMLQKSAENREDIKEEILLLLKNRISPYISKLKKRDLDDKARDFVEVIETNIQDIVSPFSQSLSFAYVNLSPKEIQVANHIKQNRSTKEIAILLNLAKGTVDVHRNNIREKLGIKNKGISLNTYLASMH